MPREARRPSALRLWLRRRRGLVRPAVRVLVAFGLFGVVLAGVAAFDPASRLYHVADGLTGDAAEAGLMVREIQIEGAANTPRPMIRTALGTKLGDPILAFSPQAARERLETLAWVESAEVERRLPGTILVRVTERRPFAIWQNQGRFAIVDREGRVVTTDRLDAFGPLPLIVGQGAEKAAAELYDLLRDAPEVLARTQALVRVGERRWNLHLHNGADVLLPEGQEAPAIARLKQLQKQNALLDRPLAAVDLRLPDRLVLRQLPSAQPAENAGNRRGSGRG
ncbi:cell division protein FtsQ/DivIB [Roseomonas sp. OT10]|uniref:cell division protein FtsQ/DivIB n=1 Tax=Roseomonas cutis TaxID=2897332 RepID=UPI001E2CAFDE|nr:cell division protein FtsQ/DivIB [Roseomonas sp. OT10]UFN47416.1 cell division protein FtsQ/DivIB [Roseomonas sp. OT10]